MLPDEKADNNGVERVNLIRHRNKLVYCFRV